MTYPLDRSFSWQPRLNQRFRRNSFRRSRSEGVFKSFASAAQRAKNSPPESFCLSYRHRHALSNPVKIRLKRKMTYPSDRSFSWQPNRDSNPNIQSQSLLCYRYTIPQRLRCVSLSATICIIAEQKRFVNIFLQVFLVFLQKIL